MIGRLRGTVAEISGSHALIDVQGVGYEVLCSQGLLSGIELNSTATVIIFTDVREDSIRLFGFSDQLERQVFDLLLRVKGVGTKIAMQIISAVDKRDLLRTIGAGKAAELTAVRGVGRKTAERIILELRDKVAEFALEFSPQIPGAAKGAVGKDSTFEDALEALLALGFSRADATGALERVQQSQPWGTGGAPDAGVVVKEALRFV